VSERQVNRPATGNPVTSLVPVAAVAMIIGLWAALQYAPTERVQGNVQRIFYFHVPAALTMYLAYGLVFLASIMYLWRRQERWDEVAAAAAEVGTLFATIVLITGPIWAKPIWGAWWVWDGRLTSTLVLWLIFVAYLMLRTYGGSAEQVARYCAVLGIIGFLDIPIVHYSVTWWRTLHPQPVIMTEGSAGGGVESTMLLALAICLVATFLLFGILLTLRLRLERANRTVNAIVETRRSS